MKNDTVSSNAASGAIRAVYNPFSIDNIIAYMECTDAKSWATDIVRTKEGENCFFGHLFNFAGSTLWNMFEECYATEYMIYPVNDGTNAAYPQATPRDRIVAYLKDLRDGRAKTTQQLCEEEFLASCEEQIALAQERRDRILGNQKQHIVSIEKKQDGTIETL